MMCNDCGAQHRYQGVLYPARKLCLCEVGNECQCGEPAKVVEFQEPIRGNKEPQARMYFCKAHKPDGFVLSIAKEEPVAEAAPKRVKRAEAPNVSPFWTAWWDKPPASAVSKRLVQCSVCKDEHRLKERRNHNGSHSECPKCKAPVYTHANDEEGATL